MSTPEKEKNAIDLLKSIFETIALGKDKDFLYVRTNEAEVDSTSKLSHWRIYNVDLSEITMIQVAGETKNKVEERTRRIIKANNMHTPLLDELKRLLCIIEDEYPEDCRNETFNMKQTIDLIKQAEQ